MQTEIIINTEIDSESFISIIAPDSNGDMEVKIWSNYCDYANVYITKNEATQLRDFLNQYLT